MTGLTGLEYNGNRYYYIKNEQDDVVGILNSNNEKIVTYLYDSWGKVLSIKDSLGNEITDGNNIGIINPYRYRSYYYDTETKLYYLNSRYYNPEWKRFINADGVLGANKDLISYNLYAYCSNNPINNADSNGNKKKKKQKKKKSSKSIINTFKIAFSLSPVFHIFKAAVTIASNVYLGLKGYNVSQDMFNKSMYAPSGDLSKKTQELIKNKSQNSSQVQAAINSCIMKNGDSNSFSDCLGYNDAEMTGDLFYSIQHIDIYVSGKRINDNTWDITISMSDIYDFKKRDWNSFSNYVNNLGYFMQDTGMLKTYAWSISYDMEYTE